MQICVHMYVCTYLCTPGQQELTVSTSNKKYCKDVMFSLKYLQSKSDCTHIDMYICMSHTHNNIVVLYVSVLDAWGY